MIMRIASTVLVVSLTAMGVEGKSLASAPLTEAQKASIRKEVTQVTRAWTQANERSDFKAVMNLYASHPDFPVMYADSEGKVMDFEGLQKSAHEGFDGATHYVVTIRREMLTVLDADTALWAFQGGWQGTLKSGAVLKADACAVSLLLRRVGRNWKIVYQHESYPPPVGVKPAELPEKGM